MPGRRPAKILMVDDRPENLLALEAILQGLGHELIKASSGEEALKCLLTTDVAVILLDVQMPGMDGFETAAHVKRREKTRDIPILFLTAIDGEAHQAFRGYAAGAVDYLAKPFDPWVLKAKGGRLRRAVRQAQRARRPGRRAAKAAGPLRLRRSRGAQPAGVRGGERAQALLEDGGPGLAARRGAGRGGDRGARALRQALPAPAAAGLSR